MYGTDDLEKLGLNQAEAAIFLFLTQHGPLRAPNIQTALNLKKLATYRALSALSDRGLVVASGDKRLQTYTAQPLQKLLDQYDQNIQQMHSARVGLEKLISDLASQQNQFYKERRIQMYEGVEGYRLWGRERLHGGGTIIREFSHNLFWEEFANSKTIGRQIVTEQMRGRLKKGVQLRSIFTGNRNLPDYARTHQDLMKESRFLATPTAPTLCLSVFGSRLGFYSGSDGKYRGMIIDDPVVANAMEFIFDILWGISEQV